MSEIGNTLINFTKGVTKTSGELFKTAKLSMSLSTEQRTLEGIYVSIGKKVHEIYMYGGKLGKFFDEQYGEIVACEGRINELKEKINAIKGTRDCPKCGKVVEKTAEFCPKCGGRMDSAARNFSEEDINEVQCGPFEPHIAERAAIPDAPEPSAPQTKKCAVCSAENEAGIKFCLSCGRIL